MMAKNRSPTTITNDNTTETTTAPKKSRPKSKRKLTSTAVASPSSSTTTLPSAVAAISPAATHCSLPSTTTNRSTIDRRHAKDAFSLSNRIRAMKLPVKLNAILSNPEFEHIISWMQHGRSWTIHDMEQFQKKIIPIFFDFQSIHSFFEILYSWGFRSISESPDKLSYYHELFRRDMPQYHDLMQCSPTSGNKLSLDKVVLEEQQQPNLYSYPAFAQTCLSLPVVPSSADNNLSIHQELLRRQLLNRSNQAFPSVWNVDNSNIPSLLRQLSTQKEILDILTTRVCTGGNTSPLAASHNLIALETTGSQRTAVRVAEVLAKQKGLVRNATLLSDLQQRPTTTPVALSQQQRHQPEWSQMQTKRPAYQMMSLATTDTATRNGDGDGDDDDAMQAENSKPTKRRKNWLPPLGPPAQSTAALPKSAKNSEQDYREWVTTNPEAFASGMT